MSETAIGEEHVPTPGEPPARGRRAWHVFEIPWQGWKDIFKRVGKETQRRMQEIEAHSQEGLADLLWTGEGQIEPLF